eukprot:CAMPEP_0177532580 /NCGR_PEP_ID=MMETSP0369-20130122/54748_1 /TAXON_ID=447022 ORGANISM="Scrippsiella hangoei-like, Strain SHHI-4" /NCGR_SAMPLE_ID=MMETSP0369 /ASSEMBLY_ACC=CAM_ASM_000364 /LENGTH=85 /DNA_ID=CAMNT_0019013991 /DNA_START=141 /DNA_END=395 /DNA_ORIENTATION=-
MPPANALGVGAEATGNGACTARGVGMPAVAASLCVCVSTPGTPLGRATGPVDCAEAPQDDAQCESEALLGIGTRAGPVGTAKGYW